MHFTPAQAQAIQARGNVLVVAGAGTGKTSTLVARCLACLLDPVSPASLDQILMVTFTEAAAAEMRQRIRLHLEQECSDNPAARRLKEQLALFETAHIGTLHSFCFQLLKQHFYQLELDPQIAILPEPEVHILAADVLDELLDGHYGRESGASRAVHELIRVYGRGSDLGIKSLIQKIYRYAHTLPQPTQWYNEQLRFLNQPQPIVWRAQLQQYIEPWRTSWLSRLEAMAAENQVAALCYRLLQEMSPIDEFSKVGRTLEEILSAAEECPRGKKRAWLVPMREFLEESDFLHSLIPRVGDDASMAEDWTWSRFHMSTLVKLAMEFGRKFGQTKRELGVVDFADLEQFALRLLWEEELQQPTPIAQRWRNRFRYVFVDEYQDINAAQDRIIQALSRDTPLANRFLVGDVKQSIYRFRLADPSLFQGYAKNWNGDAGITLSLTENFRSREGILRFVNSFFAQTMTAESGGTDYSEANYLKCGESRDSLSLASSRCVELQIRVKNSTSPEVDEEPDGPAEKLAGLEEADKEARLVGLRLRKLKARLFEVWDEMRQILRPADWGDMAVLVRAPANKAESYAKEFSRLNIPLQVGGGSFFESQEIQDLLNILCLLDNPFQDIPLLAVLRSPVVGLSLEDLGRIRLAERGSLWMALRKWLRQNQGQDSSSNGGGSAMKKGSLFLKRFAQWRRLTRQSSLTMTLETILAETQYEAWVLSQSRPAQRQANLHRLLHLTRQFDQFQKQGLFRFLRFVEAQRMLQTQGLTVPYAEENAVQLLSIHQSKGLEFPIVVVADLGKPFNEADLNADIILDKELGVCARIRPPGSRKWYPSWAHWRARQRQRQELLNEELRLLYVAMTRAKDLLILSASVSEKDCERLWNGERGKNKIKSDFDWVSSWLTETAGALPANPITGENEFLAWRIFREDSLMVSTNDALTTPECALDPENPAWRMLPQRLSWLYPYARATREPAKTTVTALRKRSVPQTTDEVSVLLEFSSDSAQAASDLAPGDRETSATEAGLAHHRFLQFVSLSRTHNRHELRQEARRLVEQGTLSAEEVTRLDFGALLAFWESDLGRLVRKNASNVYRELAFTARFTASELQSITGRTSGTGMQNEFIVVQGVADLLILQPKELILIDYKTDHVTSAECLARGRMYAPQVELYAKALSSIYRRDATNCWLYFLACSQAIKVKPSRKAEKIASSACRPA